MLGTGYFLKIAKINYQQEKPICPNCKTSSGLPRKCSAIFGHLQKFSEILGKCSGTFVWSSGQFEKSSEIFGRWSEIFAALTREILFLPLEHKIHIFSPPCNILYISIPHFAVPDGFRRVKFSQEYFRKFFVTWLNKKLLHYCCGT